VRLLDN